MLAYKCSFPDGPLKQRLEQAAKGELNEANAPNVPRCIRDGAPDRIRAAAAVIDGPEWKAALAAFLPRDEEGMAPLFAAIAHGCAAGRHDEAFNEVYWPRIARGNEDFASKKLGLYGAELAAVAHFFAEPFGVPAPGLSPARQALVLSLAGFRLRALGRLEDAVAPMRAGAKLQADQEDWKNAASGHSNLSELLVTLGRLRGLTPGPGASVETPLSGPGSDPLRNNDRPNTPETGTAGLPSPLRLRDSQI